MKKAAMIARCEIDNKHIHFMRAGKYSSCVSVLPLDQNKTKHNHFQMMGNPEDFRMQIIEM